jgi:hypothetical protein
MTTIFQNVDLAPTNTGFETCAANAGDVAFYTGNWFAAYSVNAGNSFNAVDPYDMMKNLPGQTFCCDQRVEYIPTIDTFAWVLLSNEGTIMLAVASPSDIASSNGRKWWYYKLDSSTFRLGDDGFDYPQISFGRRYLFLTANPRSGAIIARFPLTEIGQRATIFGQFIKADTPYVCPCHNTGNVAWFGALKSDSEVRVYTWEDDTAAWVFWFDRDITTIPNTDFSSFTRDGDDWLPPTSKIQSIVTGAARAGDRLWLAWSAGRKYANGQASPITQPHIEYVIVNVPQKAVEVQRYIWNRNFAFAWPSLAGNWGWQIQDPKIAMSFCFGGGRDLYPQHAVSILGDPPSLATTSGRTAGAGGHYNDVRMCFPDTRRFVAAGFVTAKDNSNPPNKVNHPHYVIFGH